MHCQTLGVTFKQLTPQRGPLKVPELFHRIAMLYSHFLNVTF